MPRTNIIFLFLALYANAQTDPQMFEGRKVTVINAHKDEYGFPKGPVKICIELPQRRCYTPPDKFRANPKISIIQVNRDLSALLFSAESIGGSGFQIHYALLRPGRGKDLDDLFNAFSTAGSVSAGLTRSCHTSALSSTPVRLGSRPDITLVRDGLQSGTCVTARSNVVPIATRRSMFGVTTRSEKCPQLFTDRMSSIESMMKLRAATSTSWTNYSPDTMPRLSFSQR